MIKQVFINCPFDEPYTEMFNAIIFTIYYCNYNPRCALEIEDSSQVRLEKIFKMIKECDYAIHDISRTELNDEGLPRFNMPFELGIFIGAKHFGSEKQKRKKCIILDSEKYRFQKFLSDVAGQDIKHHKGQPEIAVESVRNWLKSLNTKSGIPGATAIKNKYSKFRKDYPELLKKRDLEIEDVQYADILPMMSEWIDQNKVF